MQKISFCVGAAHRKMNEKNAERKVLEMQFFLTSRVYIDLVCHLEKHIDVSLLTM
jgi:hypothetical protein